MVTFTGGEKLQKKLAELATKVKNARTLEVGFLEKATYPDGTSVAMVAAVNEFGAPSRGQPPRPFFRGMIAKESPHWGDDLARLLKTTNLDAHRTLLLMAERVKGELQQSIRDTNDPPLAPSTIAAKGFDKPLIDTSHMINSVDGRVRK